MASITITVPDAAVPYIRAICIEDGWDQITPATLGGAVEKQVKEYYKRRYTEQKAREQQAQMQSVISQAVADATAALGL